MPTLPPGQAGPPGLEPHQYRRVAESFGSNAQRYDCSRPSYPRALVDRIIAGSPGRDVLDVGCGTGIAARQFQAAGCRVLGVDPDDRMAAVARRHGVEVEVAMFEAWNQAGRVFDAIVCGQAWHWVDPVAGAAKAARALRPAGRLAVFWNAFLPPPGIGEAIAEVYRRVVPELPISRIGLPGPDVYAKGCAKAAGAMLDAGAFSDPDQWRFDWQRSYTRDEWLDLLPTLGGHSQFPQARLQDLLSEVGAAIDAAGGRFTMGYATLVTTATRVS